MIHEVYVLLRAALAAKGVPFDVIYGPTQVPPTVGASRIQILRDYENGDQIGAARSRPTNPKMFAIRGMGAIARVHAMSTIAGAQRHDHERVADAIADQLQIELYRIARNAKTLIHMQRAGLVADATTDGWAGVVYELRFVVDRGVVDTTWVGDKAPEGTFKTGITSPTTDGPGTSKQLPNATTRNNES